MVLFVRKNAMRKYLASLVFTGCALATTPLVAAPSVDEAPPVIPAVTVHQVKASSLPDQAAMVLVGTALIGLAAAVRRAV